MNKLHILAIAAHPDDVELGCAGTLAKHCLLGQEVGILDLTQGELSTRGTVLTRKVESDNSAKVLGIKVRENANLKDGFFQNNEQDIMKVIPFIRRYRPNIVIASTLSDRHPDHGRAGRLISDACFLAGLMKIETFWLNEKQEHWRPKRVFHMMQDRMIEPDFIVDISSTHNIKMSAIRCFDSQFHNLTPDEPKTYISGDNFMNSVIARDSLMGKKIGVKFGEGFTCENTIGIINLDSLILPELP